MVKGWIGTIVVGMAILFLLVQAVPYGRDHTNPPVRQEPVWDGPRTRELAARACFDCHSNLTDWPWYSNLAPVSWLVQRDVHEGRRKVNFSEWDRPQKEAGESAKATRKGEMPPWYYPWARLSAAERDALVQGLAASLGQGEGGGRGEGAERHKR